MTEDARVKEILHRWEALQEQGQSVSIESLCASCPDLIDQVSQQIHARGGNNALRQQWDAGGQEPSSHPSSTSPATEAAEPPSRGESLSHGEPLDGVMVVGRYLRLQFHDEGGLGEVYIGEEDDLHRQVALKFLKRGRRDEEEGLSRFFTEAEITSQLDHPGVVPVYGIGKAPDGRPFYVMRLIRGENLKHAIDEFHKQGGLANAQPGASVEFRKLLACFVSACNTLAYAHNRGIVHLDIKPANIMLGKYGESLVVDWGLATPVSRDAHARASGEMTLRPSTGVTLGSSSGKGMGTPAYMSPEQIPDSIIPVGPASDIYSLGATLYKILTGKAPCTGASLDEFWDRIRTGDITPPHKLDRHVPAALDAICMKAMAHQPEQRYLTALDLAADIERWLADQQVSVYRAPLPERLGRWTRHHRGLALATGVGLVLLVLLSTLAAIFLKGLADRERDARDIAEQARREGIQVAARFAGRTVASEIDLRWRILEAQASDGELRRLLEKAEKDKLEDADLQAIQAWLDAQFAEHRNTTKASSWILNDIHGVQLGRSPYSDRTVGKNYAFRDYFHGQGYDLDPEEGKKPPPLRSAHLSQAFQSQADASYKVAFTVPVWNSRPGMPSRHVIGVLGMSVEVGHFAALRGGLGENQIAVLVDTREDQLNKVERSGLILHHPRLAEKRLQIDNGTSSPVYRVDQSQVALFRKLRKQLLLLERQDTAASEALIQKYRQESLSLSYHDPLADDPTSDHLAAFEPVLVAGREDESRDTGLVVIVQERLPSPGKEK